MENHPYRTGQTPDRDSKSPALLGYAVLRILLIMQFLGVIALWLSRSPPQPPPRHAVINLVIELEGDRLCRERETASYRLGYAIGRYGRPNLLAPSFSGILPEPLAPLPVAAPSP